MPTDPSCSLWWSYLWVMLDYRSWVFFVCLDFSFPILTISSGVLLNAIHFTLIANGEHEWIPFLRKLCGNIKNWILYLVHVIILVCGLISLTQFEQDYHLILLPTVFLPAVLYILLYKFTATSAIRSINNWKSNGTRIKRSDLICSFVMYSCFSRWSLIW